MSISYVCRLYELHELCKLCVYFYESLKITSFLFLQNLEFCLLICKDGKPKL